MIGDMILDQTSCTIENRRLLTFHSSCSKKSYPKRPHRRIWRLLERGLPPDTTGSGWHSSSMHPSSAAQNSSHMSLISWTMASWAADLIRTQSSHGLFGGGSHRFREMLKKEHKGLFTNPQEEVEALLAEPVEETGEMPERGKPIVREDPKIGRNDPCPCGSGKKYKKCCGQ